MPEFNEWESFYLLVGGAAGALIGLQFVVMTLIADRPQLRAAEATSAFGTPTIVHFCAALLLSALLRVPWHSIIPAAALWGLTGFSGVAYILIIARRMRKQSAYQPDLEDWSYFIWLPLAAYVMLSISAFAAVSHPREALFCVGACALLLLFIGIRNSWDSIAYLVVNTANPNAEPDKSSEKEKR